MTAEIAVMNKQAIALAADSAVTVGAGAKIYASVNKIFALSKYEPVGIMIYGSAELMGVPWETIIKNYRAQLKERQFDTIGEHAVDFVKYVGGCRELFPADVQRATFAGALRQYFGDFLRKEIQQRVTERIEDAGSITEKEVERIVDSVVDQHWTLWSDAKDLSLVPDDFDERILETYEVVIAQVVREVFEKLPISDTAAQALVELAVMTATKAPPVPIESLTGVVIAGYGKAEHFPTLVGLEVDSVACDTLICWVERMHDVDRTNRGFVSAFAQKEMVQRFMAGVDQDYQEAIEESLDEILRGYTDEIFKQVGKSKITVKAKTAIEEARDELLTGYIDALAEHRQTRYVDTVTRAVATLPLSGLAEMAESLVNLTSLKRKVSMQTESVGGPIDVAVITRGDGFIWIKRKHYFSADRNPQFFSNYYRES